MSDAAQYAVTLLADESRGIAQSYLGQSSPDHPVAVLVGADGVVVDIIKSDDAAGFAARLLERVRAAPRAMPRSA